MQFIYNFYIIFENTKLIFQVSYEQKISRSRAFKHSKMYTPPDEYVSILQPSDFQLIVKTTKPLRRAKRYKYFVLYSDQLSWFAKIFLEY